MSSIYKKLREEVDAFGKDKAQHMAEIRQLLQNPPPGVKIEKVRFNFLDFYSTVFKESSIEYTFFDFIQDTKPFNAGADRLATISKDLGFVNDLVQHQKLSKTFNVFCLLKFYASNYDLIINILTKVCNQINKAKSILIYKKGQNYGKPLRIDNAETLFQFLKTHNKRLFFLLKKILNQHIRNKISHEEYLMKGNFIRYKINGKKSSIHLNTIYKYLPRMGWLIHLIQYCLLEFTDKFNKYVIYNKIPLSNLKKELQSSSFL